MDGLPIYRTVHIYAYNQMEVDCLFILRNGDVHDNGILTMTMVVCGVDGFLWCTGRKIGKPICFHLTDWIKAFKLI